jgi:hypothetical protein
VLFDPVFTHRCSPFSWLGPARYTPAPCNIEDIPIIDAVVISHNHYDHLSLPTILKIKEKHPNVQFFAPLGLKTARTPFDRMSKSFHMGSAMEKGSVIPVSLRWTSIARGMFLIAYYCLRGFTMTNIFSLVDFEYFANICRDY